VVSPSPVLSLSGVAKLYGPKLVFKDLSLAVYPGEIWLLVGANGAGKSTLLSVMSGLSKPDRGTVIRHLPPERMGYLGHKTFIYPRLTALANLAFWARLYGLPAGRKELLAALERVGLSRVAEEEAGTFSRGMAQRLNLARVFLPEPGLIFLDEPATGLDARSSDVLVAALVGARKRGAAMVWVSHAVHRDLALADNVLHLDAGRAAYVGPARDYTPEGAVC
jgi:heme exporter protein A